jgi:hypothetical protein
MITRLVLLVFFLLGSFPAFASDFIDKIEGVYKEMLEHNMYDSRKDAWEPFKAENILEIVRISPTSAYIRYDLVFENGHTCGLTGIAEQKGNALLYTDIEPVMPGEFCKLQLSIEKKKLETKDISTRNKDGFSPCSAYCGARGRLEGSFAMNAKRKIRYMDRLKNSSEYKGALAGYAEKSKTDQ